MGCSVSSFASNNQVEQAITAIYQAITTGNNANLNDEEVVGNMRRVMTVKCTTGTQPSEKNNVAAGDSTLLHKLRDIVQVPLQRAVSASAARPCSKKVTFTACNSKFVNLMFSVTFCATLVQHEETEFPCPLVSEVGAEVIPKPSAPSVPFEHNVKESLSLRSAIQSTIDGAIIPTSTIALLDKLVDEFNVRPAHSKNITDWEFVKTAIPMLFITAMTPRNVQTKMWLNTFKKVVNGFLGRTDTNVSIEGSIARFLKIEALMPAFGPPDVPTAFAIRKLWSKHSPSHDITDKFIQDVSLCSVAPGFLRTVLESQPVTHEKLKSAIRSLETPPTISVYSFKKEEAMVVYIKAWEAKQAK